MPRLELDPFIIPANIRTTRQALGCTPEEFACLLGVTANVLGRYESSLINSFPAPDKLELIVGLAGVSKKDFLGGVLLLEELHPPSDRDVLLSHLPAEGYEPKSETVHFQPRQSYKRSRRSRMIRGFSLGVAVLAILIAYIMHTIPWKLNPNAVVYVIAEEGDFHAPQCTLLAEAEAQGIKLRPLTVAGALQKGYSPCALCIPPLKGGGGSAP